MFSVRHLSAAVRWSPIRILPILAISGILGIGCAGMATAFPVDIDVVIGIPDAAPGTGVGLAGRVDVHPRVGERQLLDEDELESPNPDSDAYSRFGAVIAIRDLNNDNYDDLVVGAPGTTGPGGQDVVGRVHLLFGSATGITTAGAIAIQQPNLTADDRFGAAVAISDRNSMDTGTTELWIGAPDHEVRGQREAGVIFRYLIDLTGTPTLLEMISQAGPLIPDTPEAGDHFGAVLADHAGHQILVGVPDEDIGNQKDAGMIVTIRASRYTNALIKGRKISQNSKGVPGTAEAGDHFGAALTTQARAVGIPGEDVGNQKDAGAVQTFAAWTKACPTLWLCPSKAFNQNSSGIPGKAEAGDRFGAALIQGRFRRNSYRCAIYPSVAIGSPGENIGGAKDAGSVTTFMLPALAKRDDIRRCPPIVLSQGHGLPGTAETGDQTGAAMGTVMGDRADGLYQRDVILTGVPGEGSGTIKQAGRVIRGTGANAPTYAGPTGDRAGQRYGSVLGTYQALSPETSANPANSGLDSRFLNTGRASESWFQASRHRP